MAPASGDHGKLFVGGLSASTTAEELKTHFKRFGAIRDAVVLVDRVTGRSRGFGFVQLEDSSCCDAVLRDTHVVDGRQVDVKLATPRQGTRSSVDEAVAARREAGNVTKVFVGGLASNTTDATIREYFSRFGEVQDACVLTEPGTRRSRGFGFVTFTEAASVDVLFASGALHTLDGRTVEIKPAVPREALPRGSRMHQSDRLHTGGVPSGRDGMGSPPHGMMGHHYGGSSSSDAAVAAAMGYHQQQMAAAVGYSQMYGHPHGQMGGMHPAMAHQYLMQAAYAAAAAGGGGMYGQYDGGPSMAYSPHQHMHAAMSPGRGGSWGPGSPGESGGDMEVPYPVQLPSDPRAARVAQAAAPADGYGYQRGNTSAPASDEASNFPALGALRDALPGEGGSAGQGGPRQARLSSGSAKAEPRASSSSSRGEPRVSSSSNKGGA